MYYGVLRIKRLCHLKCEECGTEYETEDGDGECPRCAQYDEVVGGVMEILRTARCKNLEDWEIEEAVSNAVGQFVRERYGKREGDSHAT